MDTNLHEKIRDQFSVLPSGLQNFIVNDQWLDTVETIANKYGLSDEQAEGLRQEILFILIGLEKLSDLRMNLVEELDITYDQALKISFDSNAQIFSSIMNELRDAQNILNGAENVSTQPPQQSQAVAAPFIPNINKSGVKVNGLETDPDHMLMDHEEMERVDGVHLHSQSVMPTSGSSRPQGGSIVDQKLSRIFSSPINQPKPQRGNDPYREPLQ